MKNGVAVTGMGIISALGNGLAINLNALSKGQDGITFPEILQTIHIELPVGEIKATNSDLENNLGLKGKHSLTRAALFGILAAGEAIESSGLSKNELLTTGFISGSSVGGMDATEKYYSEYEGSISHRQYIPAQHPG